MADHSEYNKIVKKLNGRQFRCKTFYDTFENQVTIKGRRKNNIYLTEEVDEVLTQLKTVIDFQQDELLRQKKKAQNLEIENYALKRRKRKNEGTNISIDSPNVRQTSFN